MNRRGNRRLENLENGEMKKIAIIAAVLFTFTIQCLAQTGSGAPRYFSPTSFWYQPIPADATLNANSAGMVTNFLAQITKYYGDVTLAWGQPVYTMPANNPTFAVTNSQSYAPLNAALAAQQAAVPILPYVVAEPNPPDTDQGLIIYQPSSDSLWDFYQFTQTSPPYSTTWGAGMTEVSVSNGIWLYPFGESATGLSYFQAQISVADMQAGAINHVMGIGLVETDVQTNVSWPANRSDGGGTTVAGTAIPEGIRFRLDPTLNLSNYNLSPVALMVAKAAQTYGFVVIDRSGGIGVYAQDPLSFTQMGLPDPWVPYLGSYEDEMWAVFENFPWDHLQFMPMNYGDPVIGVGVNIASGSPSTPTTFDAPAGSLIVVALAAYDNPDQAFTALKDSAGNTYVRVAANTVSSNVYNGEIWACINSTHDLPAGGTLTATIAGQNYDLVAAVFAGFNGGVNISVGSNNNSTTMTSVDPAISTGEMAESGELVVGLLSLSSSGGGYFNESPGWQQFHQSWPTEPGYGIDFVYRISKSTAAVSYGPSWTNDESYGAALASFKATGSSKAPQPRNVSSSGTLGAGG